MIIFIILRILDVITTLLNIYKYGGWEVELNPITKFIGMSGMFTVYQFFMTLFAIVVIERLIPHKNLVYGIFSGISLIAVLINIYCLTL